MIFQFKCRPAGGRFRRPELAPVHVVQGGPMNEMQLKMALRKLYRACPELRLPREMSVDSLPDFVSIDQAEFMAIVTIDYSQGSGVA